MKPLDMDTVIFLALRTACVSRLDKTSGDTPSLLLE